MPQFPSSDGRGRARPPVHHRLSGAYDGLLRRVVRRAFTDPAVCPAISYAVRGVVTRDPCAVMPPPAEGSERVAIIVPTYVGRCSAKALFKTLEPLGRSMEVARGELRGYEFVLVIAMQWEAPQTEQSCHARLAELERAWSGRFDAAFVGVSISHRSKLLALNSCRPLMEAAGVGVVGWIDDDVVLDERCLAELLAAFEPSVEGIYGARKVTVSDGSRFSRWWAGRKNRIEPVNLYPHGCCMLMSERVFRVGIPLVHQSDDHHFLLRFLEPEDADPLRRLRVVPRACLYCPTANRPGTILGRIRRNYSNVLRVLADAPAPTVRFFLRDLMFQNLRLPRALREVWSATYWTEMFWHLLKLLFWLSCAGPVLVRGVLNRPRVPRWYSAPFPLTLSSGDED